MTFTLSHLLMPREIVELGETRSESGFGESAE
jgi:hypothetical protein